MSILSFKPIEVIPSFNICDLQTTKKALTAVDFIAQVAIDAFKSFSEKRYEDFDALVGETSCQIRVSMLLDFCRRKDLDFSNMTKKIDAIREKILALKAKDIVPKKVITFEEFCKQNDIYLDMPTEMEILIKAFILTKSKDQSGLEKTKSDNLQLIVPGIGKRFCDDLVKSFQRSLSKESVEYLQDLARLEKVPLTPDLVFTSEKGIQALPCYTGVEILIKHLLRERHQILLKCTSTLDKTQKFILFKSNGATFDFEVIEDISKYKDSFYEPVFVVEGYCSGEIDVKKIVRFGFEGILKANAAQHHQYFGEGKDIEPFEGKPEFDAVRHDILFHKKLALEEGFSYENPSTFCIEHIICKTLEKALR